MGGLPMAKGVFTEGPECGQSVLRDNLRYHQRKVHGPADAAPRRGPKRAPPPPARPNTALLMTVAVVVIAVVFGTYYVLVVAPGGSNDDGGGNGTTNPIVLMSTNYGNIRIELDVVKAPVTVANFLSHVDPGHYDNTAIHRVAANFVIQGGQLSVTADRVAWERTNLLNSRGTSSMARGGEGKRGEEIVFNQPRGQREPGRPERGGGLPVRGVRAGHRGDGRRRHDRGDPDDPRRGRAAELHADPDLPHHSVADGAGAAAGTTRRRARMTTPTATNAAAAAK